MGVLMVRRLLPLTLIAPGLVLERMSNPSDYWQVIADYRNRFAPLRRRIAAERDQWDGRTGQYAATPRRYGWRRLEDRLQSGSL